MLPDFETDCNHHPSSSSLQPKLSTIGFVGPNCLSLQSCVIEGFNILLKSVQQFVSGTTRKGHLGPGKPLILVQSIIK